MFPGNLNLKQMLNIHSMRTFFFYVKRKSHVIHVFKKLYIIKKNTIMYEIMQELYKFVLEMLFKKLVNLVRFACFSWFH